MADPNMQPASFRGVKFHVKSSDGEIGRRNVVNQYPQRDLPNVEDLGRKARTFSLDVFVLGDDYMTQRDALEAAFEQPGPGELVHPWRGRMIVSVTSCNANETIDEQRKVRWSVTFTEAGENVQPGSRVDTVAIVDTSADDAIAAAEEDFSEAFSLDGLPEFVELDGGNAIKGMLDSVLASSRAMLPDFSILPEFNLSASNTLSVLTAIMRQPTDLASALTGQISGVLGLSSGPVSAFKALQTLFGYGQDERRIARTTPARTQQAINREAVNTLTSRTAVIEAARSTATTEFASYNDAVATRDVIVEALESEALTAPDPVYLALNDLRVAVIRDISERGANLARVVSYTPRSTTPALVIAHQVYGDATRADEIISRNKIARPGFVRGGQVLEVLSDA